MQVASWLSLSMPRNTQVAVIHHASQIVFSSSGLHPPESSAGQKSQGYFLQFADNKRLSHAGMSDC